jgi:D-alanyl-D-alanine carboxypeptidase
VAGRVRAKTGTLAAVRTLAGYVGVDSSRPLAFAILINDIPPGQKPASRDMADDMLETIVAFLEASTKR